MAFLASFLLSSHHLLLAVGLCAFARLFVALVLSLAHYHVGVCSVHTPFCRCFLSWQLIWVLACPCYLVLACVPRASALLFCGARTLTRSFLLEAFFVSLQLLLSTLASLAFVFDQLNFPLRFLSYLSTRDRLFLS